MIGAMLLRTKLTRIQKILEQERLLLLSGDIENVPGLVAERSDMIESLRGETALDDAEFRELLSDIQRLAKRNAGLLSAAIDGMRGAEDLLAKIDASQSRLGAYGADGKLTATETVKPRHERRA